MTGPDLTCLTWRKSSRSGTGENINCVEVAETTGGIAIRDSKDPSGGVLLVDRAAWRTFASGIRQADLDAAS
jgi:hypothetical protein